METSSEKRKALARGGMEAFNEGDMPRMLAVLAEDVEVYASPEMVNAGTFTGHDGFVTWINAWTEAWDEISNEVTDNTAVGDRHVVTTIRQEGRGRAGIVVSMELAFLFEMNDEELCSFLAMLPTPEEAIRMAEEREVSRR
jgi:ketosteroid isomerase-like protein